MTHSYVSSGSVRSESAANKVRSLILDKIVYTVVHLDPRLHVHVSDFIFKSGHPHWQIEVFSVCMCDCCSDVYPDKIKLVRGLHSADLLCLVCVCVRL